MTTYYREDMHLSQPQVYALQITWATVYTIGTSVGGWLADRFGIRRILISGTALHLLGTVYFATCREFWQFEIALVVTGLHGSLLGGTTDTLCTASLRKSVVDRGVREELYKQYQHSAQQVRAIMAPLAILLGNAVWRLDPYLPFKLQIVINVIPLVAAYKTIEPRMPAPHLTRDVIRKRLLVLLRDRRDIRWASTIFVVIGASLIAGFWVIQPLMTDAHISKSLFGGIYAVQAIGIGLLLWVVKPLQKKHPIVMWGFLAAVTGLGALGAGLGGIFGVVVVFIGFSLARAAAAPFLACYLAEALGEDDETRATDISIIDSLQSAVFVLIGLAMMAISGAVQAKMIFLIIGIICIVFSSLALLGLRKATAKRPAQK